MNIHDLADFIRARFTPFAFTCECEGTDPECFETRRNPSMIAMYETIERIATFIEEEYAASADTNNRWDGDYYITRSGWHSYLGICNSPRCDNPIDLNARFENELWCPQHRLKSLPDHEVTP